MEKRTKFTVYSHDPLAKAAKKCGYESCFLDFSKIPDESVLKNEVTEYCYMGERKCSSNHQIFDNWIMGKIYESNGKRLV